MNSMTKQELFNKADEIKNSISVATSEIMANGTVYYVDNELGSSTYNGTSPDTPWKCIEQLEVADLKSGDTVLFKRGQVFRGTFGAIADGVTYSAYGEGAKPVLSASINAADENLWLPTAWENVWMFKSFISYVRDVGNIVFNDGECWGIKVFVNHKTNQRCDMFRDSFDKHNELDVFNGRTTVHREEQIWNGPKDLKGDLEFYHDGKEERLFLYCANGNPGKYFKNIEIMCHYSIFENNGFNDITFDNIAFKYTDLYAINSTNANNLTVKNCEFGWIGGTTLLIEEHRFKYENISTGDFPVRTGSAIKLNGKCSGLTVKNNYFYQIYDAAISFPNDTEKTVIENNVIDSCNWSFEFTCETDSKSAAPTIANNISMNNGLGWSRQRPDNQSGLFLGTDIDASNVTNNCCLNAKDAEDIL